MHHHIILVFLYVAKETKGTTKVAKGKKETKSKSSTDSQKATKKNPKEIPAAKVKPSAKSKAVAKPPSTATKNVTPYGEARNKCFAEFLPRNILSTLIVLILIQIFHFELQIHT